jgi:DNA-binding NtrC family response regulator
MSAERLSTSGGAHLCLVEDDVIMGESMVDRLQLEGIRVEWFRDVGSALEALIKRPFVALVSDIRLPDASGEALFAELIARKKAPPPTLFITAHGTLDQAVRLLKLGAQDYITKPFELDELLLKLQAIAPSLFNSGENNQLMALGVSPAMQRIESQLRHVAKHQASVVITGESGVGKEHAARLLHEVAAGDDSQPFEAVNCAAFSESLLEAELFGYEKGAFTGAVRAHRGVFERADGGMLFLDEIGDMPPSMQVKLLRTLQDSRFARIGSEKVHEVSIRLVCATNKNLRELIRQGIFREDLYYRINVVHLHIPPLRERPEDIIWFARRFVDEFATKHGTALRLSPTVESLLLSRRWSGNIRQLHHVIEHACIFAHDQVINTGDIESQADADLTEDFDKMNLRAYLDHCEARWIRDVLKENDWRINETAAALEISRKNLWEKMRKYGISQNS